MQQSDNKDKSTSKPWNLVDKSWSCH